MIHEHVTLFHYSCLLYFRKPLLMFEQLQLYWTFHNKRPMEEAVVHALPPFAKDTTFKTFEEFEECLNDFAKAFGFTLHRAGMKLRKVPKGGRCEGGMQMGWCVRILASCTTSPSQHLGTSAPHGVPRGGCRWW